ncbi:MAG: ThiF family adenylyltransferase [Dehalococcoidales bacterium]
MIERYSRQTLLRELGEKGQKKLGNSSIVVIGCGALGGIIATSLVRAGVGRVKLIDRDLIEYHNLHRQVLFDEEDVKNQLPKAIAAERHLKKVNSSVEVEGVVADVNYANIERLVTGTDLILDGLDNPETRFIINDASLKLKIPWVYGAAITTSGMTMNIIPGEPPCFRCLFPFPPPPGIIATCDRAGVIGVAPYVIGSLQSVEAIKILIGAKGINRDIIYVDVWEGTFHRLKVRPRQDCPACQGRYDFLQVKFGIRTTILCGQNSVQVLDPKVESFPLKELAKQLKLLGKVNLNKSMLRFTVNGHEMVVFPDGRLILRNSLDESLARELYLKYIEDKIRP